MLKLRSRASDRFKCPTHPRQKYEDESYPASCEACHAIAAVKLAADRLELAKRRASRWIAMKSLGKEANNAV